MDKFIGIIAAEDKELEAIKEIMDNLEEISIYNLRIFKGKIASKICLLVKCGIGKVNSARTTQILIDKFDIKYVINLGSAGALNDGLNIGDIVIGSKLIQHDFDLTAFGKEKGYIPEVGKIFESDKTLIEKCKKIELENINIIEGTIISGDIFCRDTKMKEKMRQKFNGDCVEMEGAAVAQSCFLSNIPYLVIRSISDIPNGKNEIDFEKYLELASKNCARILKEII